MSQLAVVAPRASTARSVPTQAVSERSATAITLTWLVRLRWGFFVAQAATIAGARYLLDVAVPILPLAIVVAVSGLSNLALETFTRRTKDPTDNALGAVFVVDTLILTALLYFAGGPANPFSAFYLVHVTITAVE